MNDYTWWFMDKLGLCGIKSGQWTTYVWLADNLTRSKHGLYELIYGIRIPIVSMAIKPPPSLTISREHKRKSLPTQKWKRKQFFSD